MLPTLSFAEKYDSQYYKDWIENECIKQSYYAKNDFVGKKIFKRCEKSAKKCVAQAKKDATSSLPGSYYFRKCTKKEIGWTGGDRSPKFN